MKTLAQVVDVAAKLAKAQVEAEEDLLSNPEGECILCGEPELKKNMYGVKAVPDKNNLEGKTHWIHRECLGKCKPDGDLYNSNS